ncbi:MAG: hypothetical protein ACYC1D_02625 [Acidimicrobiales bacterium]
MSPTTLRLRERIRRRAPPSGASEPGARPGPTATISLGPGVEWLQPSLQACLGPAFSVTPGVRGPPGDLVVLSGDDPASVVGFACSHPELCVVALSAAQSEERVAGTSRAVNEGAAQRGQDLGSIPLLAAHLRALARRRA